MTTSVAFKWTPNIKILLFGLFFFPVCITAGLWQLDRADQKADSLAVQESRKALPAIDLVRIPDSINEPDHTPGSANFRQVVATGVWGEGHFFLDNQVRSGRPGYDLLSILKVDGLAPVLVNRGWYPASLDRSILPEIELTADTVKVTGTLYRSTQKPFTLGKPIWTNQWPERVQAVEFDELENRLGQPLFPYMLRSSDPSPAGYPSRWAQGSEDNTGGYEVGPEKHHAYAVQWFLMAATLVLLVIFANSNLWSWVRQQHDANY